VGDKEKRAKFDSGEIDAAGNPRGFDPGPQGFRGGPGGGGPRDFNFTWANQEGETAAGFNPEDIFSELLGGGRRRRPATRKGEDYALSLTIGFEEAALGETRRVILPDGRELDMRIPTGVKDGQQIRLKGQGGPGRNGGPAGDILLSVSVSPHPYLTREDNNLKMDLAVSLREAVLGGKVTVPTLTGPVALTVPANSNTGAVLRLKGKGIPAHGQAAAGNLYVRLVVYLPDTPDKELREFATHWDNAYDPRARMKQA